MRIHLTDRVFEMAAAFLECAICYDSLNGQEQTGHELYRSSGNGQEDRISHLFHKECLKQALLSNPELRCPLCRKQFSTRAQQLQLVEAIEQGRADTVAALIQDYIFSPNTLQNAQQAAIRYQTNECLQVLHNSGLYSRQYIENISAKGKDDSL